MASHSNFEVWVSSYILAPGATASFELNTADFSECQCFVKQSYATTASTTGLSASATDGTGARPPVGTSLGYIGTANPTTPIFYDSVVSVVSLNAVTPSSTNQSSITRINLLITQIGSWYKLNLRNLDASNACTISVYGDAG